MSTRPLISIVTPVFNEEDTIDLFVDAIAAQMAKMLGDCESYEIVFVNDGSRDATISGLRRLAQGRQEIVVVDLSRNFGKEVALTAGLDFARGETVVPMDVDLQDPPDLLPEMLEKWRQGYEVVLAKRVDRSSDTAFKRLSAKTFYRILHHLADVDIPENVGDFRLMDRRVVEALRRFPERSRFMKGLFAWLGFRQTTVTFARPQRSAGEGKQRLGPLLRLAAEGLISFTSLPLRIWSFLGVITATLSLTYGFFVIVRTLVLGVDVPGYASLIVLVLLFGGLNMLSVGILGEYVARIFQETKQRPVYLVRETIGTEMNDR